MRTLLDGMPEAVRLAVVRSGSKVLRASKGRTLLGAGAPPTTGVYFILEGAAQVLMHSASGREVSVRLVGPGEMFGEIGVLDGRPRSATVVATENLSLIPISRAQFMECMESPDVALWLARRLAAEVRRLTERVFELSALNVAARLHCELLRLAASDARGDGPVEIRPAPTHAELANRIGTHREAVTREMGYLTERRIIRAGRRSLAVVDVLALAQLVAEATGVSPDVA